MDPYGNPYGYSHRGGHRPFRPNFNRPPPAASHYPNMTLSGYPARPAPPHIPPPAAAATTERNKLNTLFVGAIPAEVHDVWIEQLLKACGVLLEWKRVKDQAGKPKGFGFATYHGPDSVLRALRVLGGEEEEQGYTGVTLKAQDGSGVEKKMIVKADDNVRKYLDSYKGSKTASQLEHEKEQDTKAMETVNSIIQSLSSGNKSGAVTTEDVLATLPTESTPSTEPMDTLSKDLAFLRERATRQQQQQTQEPQQQNDSSENHQRQQEQEQRHRSHHRDDDRRQDYRRRSHRQEFVRSSSDQASQEVYEYDPELAKEEENMERRRQEKIQKDLAATFRQRVKRFEQAEAAQLRDYKDDLKREKEDQRRRAQDKEYWSKRLSEWDDNIEMKKEENEYYTDRSRWRKARAGVRRREEERDERDRRLEMEKMQAIAEANKESVTDRSHVNEYASTPGASPSAVTYQPSVPTLALASADQAIGIQTQQYRQQQQQEKEMQQQGMLTGTHQPSVTLPMKPMKPIATKIKKNVVQRLPSKRASGLGGDDDDDEDSGRKRRVLIPLDYSEIENDGGENGNEDDNGQQEKDTVMGEAKPVSEEERNEKIKSLIASIPSSEDELWKWPVQWEVLNDNLIAEKLGPFVSKKIFELIEEEEKELEAFILKSVKEHVTPLDLVNELEMALGEDALVFVMKLWRTIIFETERVARHL